MRKVYICSPYRAKDGAELDRNIDYAQQLTRQALEAGLAPITPHLYMTQCMDDKKPEERARGMAAGLALLKGCDFVRVHDVQANARALRMTEAIMYGKEKEE